MPRADNSGGGGGTGSSGKSKSGASNKIKTRPPKVGSGAAKKKGSTRK